MEPTRPVTAENWQRPPQLHWAFQHLSELFPTATIARGAGPVAPLLARGTELDDVAVYSPVIERWTTVGAVLATTFTDGWLVLRDGEVLAERYGDGMAPDTRHLLMSVSKSLVGCVAAALLDAGTLAEHAPVSTYVPALAGTGYGDATVRHLLDMRSGVAFSEEYLNADAEVRVLEQAFGWAPRRDDDVPESLFGFLATLGQKSEHGGVFEYRSSESDVLGWVCEAAAGVRMPALMSDLLWSRLGAEHDAYIGVDAEGTGMFDGGICTTLRDLARVGAMIAADGVSLTGARVVPASWIADSYAGGPDSRAAFAASPGDNRMPGGMYRNQFWFPHPDRDVLLGLGIHGQLLYVDRLSRLVVAKLSSWPVPQDAASLFGTLAACDAIADTMT